jgi:salicylate hydroxylase
MTKVFNYWAMRDKVDKIGIVTDRIILAKRTCCSLLPFLLSSPRHFLVETAYLLGVHCWEHEMLKEAGGEFIALHVRFTIFLK